MFTTLAASLQHAALQRTDLLFSREVHEHASPLLTQVMRVITRAGDAAVLLVVGSIAAAVCVALRRPRASAMIGLGLLSLPANVALKAVWNRARPDGAFVTVLVREPGTSFPSGHAMGSATIYALLAALVWLHLPPGRSRVGISAALATLVLAILASRVYLGAHWFSDVVAGAAIGLAFAILVLRWYLADLGSAKVAEAN